MQSMMRAFATLSLAALGLGCSSKASNVDGGKGDASSPGMDAPGRLDTRDSSGAEASATRDAKDGRSDSQVDARATQDAAVDALRGADGKANDGKRDGKLDGNLGGNLDVGPVVGSCESPIEIPYYLSHTELTVNTTYAEHLLDFPCAANGGDIVFSIQSNNPEMAYADTFGTPWNTALFFSESCERATPPEGDGVAACSDDACETTQSQAFAALAYGRHYLIVSGVNGESGEVKIHFQHAPIGNGPFVTLPKGSGTVTGTTEGIDSTRTCDTSGPKNTYWWTSCPADVGGPFHATTCLGATWDSYLFLQIPQTEVLSCFDDDPACGMQATIDSTIPPGAGMYAITVTGALLKSFGDYTLTYSRP
jgi:hypothetical protein